MAIYVGSLSAPTAGGGIQTFIDTESWELVTTGVDDFHRPIVEREPLTDTLKEWMADPEDVAYDGRELVQLVLQNVPESRIPPELKSLISDARSISGLQH